MLKSLHRTPIFSDIDKSENDNSPVKLKLYEWYSKEIRHEHPTKKKEKNKIIKTNI